MQITAIQNVNFYGIKVLKSKNGFYDSPQGKLYDEMCGKFESYKSLYDTIDIKTTDEAIKEINDAMMDKQKAEGDKIKAKYSRFYNFFFKGRKLRELQKQIEEETSALIANVKEDPNIAVKVEMLSALLRTLNEGSKKIDTSDIALTTNIVSGSNSEYGADKINSLDKKEGFRNVAGYSYEKSVLYNLFISKVQRERAGEDPDIYGSILFFGPWGNGKTYMARNVAGETGCNITRIKKTKIHEPLESVMQRIKNEAQKAQELFEQTRVRTIIFIDEADKLIGKDSPICKEFEDFVKVCSKKYHCTVFAATNAPSLFGVNMDDPDIFPVRMSIDIPDDDTLKSVLEFYIKAAAVDEVDFDELLKILQEKRQKHEGNYNNAQIKIFCNTMAKELGKKGMTYENILEYIKSHEIIPAITDDMTEHFERECEIYIGDDN